MTCVPFRTLSIHDGDITLRFNWSCGQADLTAGYQVFLTLSRTDDPYGVLPTAGWGGPEGLYVTHVSGSTYKATIPNWWPGERFIPQVRIVAPSNQTWSPLSTGGSAFRFPGDSLQPVSLSVSATDPDGTIHLSWQEPAEPYAGTWVQLFSVRDGVAKPVTPISSDQNGVVVAPGLDGTKLFAVVAANLGIIGIPGSVYSGYSNMVDGGGLQEGLVAPANLTAAWQDGKVVLTWANTPDNESGYYVERAEDRDFTVDVTHLADTDADVTTYSDDRPDKVYYYRVYALGQSTETPSVQADAAVTQDEPTTGPSGDHSPATAPATTQPTITAYFQDMGFGWPKMVHVFTVDYKGPGTPRFFQDVFILASVVTPTMRAHEIFEHGGTLDPFLGWVADNSTGNPNRPYGPAGVTPESWGWQMQDEPGFPRGVYPNWPGFYARKSFVTTVRDSAGNVLKTITWHVTRNPNGQEWSEIVSVQ